MQTYPFICEEGTYQAYGYFPLKDFPEEIYNCFCKGKLPTYDCTGNRTIMSLYFYLEIDIQESQDGILPQAVVLKDFLYLHWISLKS